jgi:hypothetical protein
MRNSIALGQRYSADSRLKAVVQRSATALQAAARTLTAAMTNRHRRPSKSDWIGTHRYAMPTVREIPPVPEAERINETQRERVRASLVARPDPAKPAHRRWAQPGS